MNLAGYLDRLKAGLGITAAQEPAWNDYADMVNGVAWQMRSVHQLMNHAMDTATWQERRDMMDRMAEARQRAFDIVQAAAKGLMTALDFTQRTKAEDRLPGLAGPGFGVMGYLGSGSRVP